MANKPSPDRLSYLFQRYLHKTYTPEEYEELMQYISEPSNDQQLRTLIDEGWQDPLPECEQNAARANTIFNTIVEQPALRPHRSGRLRPLATYMAAAVLLLVIGTGLFYYNTKPAPAPGSVVQQTPGSLAFNDHRYIRLPDGSKVLLNAGSQLQYPDSFGSTRVVHLTGEAYFDIRHDANKPFIVMAGNTKTVVLGTAFDIKAFPGESNVVVTVTRGKVRVEKDNQTVGVLTPNEQLVVNENNSLPVKETVNTTTAIAWKQDDILLDDVPLRVAAQELEQRFHCSINFSRHALENCRVTASFLHHETLNQIIQVVARINSMNYRFDNDSTVMLSGEGCPD